MTLFSVLDLAPVCEGSNATKALHNALDLAQHVEKWGFNRYWVAEHHNFPGIASAATSVVIGYIAGGTSTIRVGAGGIMLPNHAPLMIAEQFGTLASLYPDRIDLGLGRAPGTDQLTMQALRRSLSQEVGDFPRDVTELQHFLKEPEAAQKIVATPGAGTNVPLWILGSSLFGAQLAAMLGLPFAFASHFAPAAMDQAIDIYRESFKPSEQLEKPHVMLGYNVCAADSPEEADLLRSSSLQSFVNMRKGAAGKLPPPIANYEATLSASEQQMLHQMARCAAVGNADMIEDQIKKFLKETEADELIIASSIFDHKARLHSYELTAEVAGRIN
ncbi:MAG: LLM class flavin-dependent oxidoreductase [Pseudomonadales bacterium]|nr:LLM class flavin-dependent oxidoreductase [Pseudomonadales bacterium]